MILLLLACEPPPAEVGENSETDDTDDTDETDDTGEPDDTDTDDDTDTAEDTDTGEEPGKARWNLLVFMNGDNDLEIYVTHDLNELEETGSNADVNVLVQADRHPGYDDSDGDWTGTRRYYIEPDSDLEVVRSPVLEDLGELDMGDPAVLAEFLLWADTNYPAEHTALVMWNHGTGWDLAGPPPPPGISDDETDGGWMSIAEGVFQSGLEARVAAEGKFDLLGFDACNMASWEVGVAMAPYANALTAAETTVGAEGFMYAPMIAEMQANAELTGQDLAARVAEDEVELGGEWTASAIDLEHIDAVAMAMDALAEAALADDGVDRAIRAARKRAASADEAWHDWYIDLGSFAEVYDHPDSAGLIVDLEDALAAAVIASHSQPSQDWATGLWSHMADTHPEYLKAYHEGAGARWAQLTRWDDLVMAWFEEKDTDTDSG